ncbi:MAG TPA: hypothetical protein VIG97_11290 [Luteimonas sp.]
MTETPKRKTPTNGGRPPGSKSVRVKAARAVDKSLALLEAVIDDEGAPYMARVVASQTILTLAGMPVTPKPVQS